MILYVCVCLCVSVLVELASVKKVTQMFAWSVLEWTVERQIS